MRKPALFIIAFATLVISGLFAASFLRPYFFNVSKRETADLDKDGIQESYVLRNGAMEIIEGAHVVWRSAKDWRIADFVLADATNDGVVDLNLSVWKPGNYGSSKPFWVSENDQSVKNHFFIFNLVDGRIKPLWQSSNLEAPNCQFNIADADKDGKNDLVAVEGSYADWPDCSGDYLAVWKWNGWGFSNEWRSEKGRF